MNKKELSEFAKLLGQKGGLKTKKKLGKKHFSNIAKLRWDKHKKDKENELSTD